MASKRSKIIVFCWFAANFAFLSTLKAAENDEALASFELNQITRLELKTKDFRSVLLSIKELERECWIKAQDGLSFIQDIYHHRVSVAQFELDDICEGFSLEGRVSPFFGGRPVTPFFEGVNVDAAANDFGAYSESMKIGDLILAPIEVAFTQTQPQNYIYEGKAYSKRDFFHEIQSTDPHSYCTVDLVGNKTSAGIDEGSELKIVGLNGIRDSVVYTDDIERVPSTIQSKFLKLIVIMESPSDRYWLFCENKVKYAVKVGSLKALSGLHSDSFDEIFKRHFKISLESAKGQSPDLNILEHRLQLMEN